MAEPEKKKENEPMSEDELLKLLLVEDEQFKDEGRDDYVDDVLAYMRKKLGTEEGPEGSDDRKGE